MSAKLQPLTICLLALLVILPFSTVPGASQDERNELIKGSRKAIINSGFSEPYFDRHFKLIDAFNKPGDQRVVWLYSLGEYETRVTDSIGYNTVGGKRTYVHSITSVLGATRDVPKTISKERARTLMSSCIGKFASESVVLMKLESDRQAGLFMMAYSAGSNQKNEREKLARKDDNRQANNGPDRPPHEDEVDNRPMKIGYINLETGKCTKGQANVTP